MGDCRRLFLAENSRGDSPDALRIGNCIDLNDLAISDGEAHDGKGLPTYGDHDPGRSIHQRRVQLRSWERATNEGLLGNGRWTMNHLGCRGPPAAKIGAQYNIGIQDCDQRIEIATPGCAKEGVDHLALPSKIRIRSRYLDALDTSPCPAGELSGRRRRSIDHGSDFIEGQPEHVMEHERKPLRR